MTKRRGRAARALGGFLFNAPISREEASAAFGAEIPLDAWQKINQAYAVHGRGLDALSASKASRKKDDKQGWGFRQAAATKALKSALIELQKATDLGRFLDEASENYGIQTFGHSNLANWSAQRLVDKAFTAISDALVIVERARPDSIFLLTEVESRDRLIRDIDAALRACGFETGTTSDRTYDTMEHEPSTVDLKPFENLLDALELLDSSNFRAFSTKIRRAKAKGGKSGSRPGGQ